MDAPKARLTKSQNRKRLGCTLLALILGLSLPELYIRFLLFSDSAWAERVGADFRDPANFADPKLDDEYWRLRWELTPEAKRKDHVPTHGVLGWVAPIFAPESLRPKKLLPLEGRRPVLLYGASYAMTMVGAPYRFEALLEQSDLKDTHVIHNYGHGGYGMDQVLLFMQETIEEYEAFDPIVIIMPVVNTDFERSSLSFRTMPKPKFQLVDDQLTLAHPAYAGSGQDFIDEHGVGITSFAWNYLRYSRTQIPKRLRHKLQNRSQKLADQGALIRAIILEFKKDLEARGLDYFFLVCESPAARTMAPKEDVVQMIHEFLEEQELPRVSDRPYILEAMEGEGYSQADLYFSKGRGVNHPTQLGNRILLRAMLAGIEQHSKQ